MAEQRVLVVGLDPDRVEFRGGDYGAASSRGGSLIKAALADSRRRLEENGYGADLCMVVLDDKAIDELKRCLDKRRYNYVVFGAGLRLNPANTDVFTRLVNTAQRFAQGATLCFNAGADDTADCVFRASKMSNVDPVASFSPRTSAQTPAQRDRSAPANPTLGHLLNRTARLLRRLADKRLAPLGLTSGHLPVLTALSAGRGLSQKALTEHAGIEQPTMAATLGRMERDGLIERQVDPTDRRSARFGLTSSMLAKSAVVEAIVAAFNEEAVEDLPPLERAGLRLTLERIIDRVERLLDGDLAATAPPLSASSSDVSWTASDAEAYLQTGERRLNKD